MKDITKVCILYPADPVGTIPGGIDTFIRGILRWAPEDISIDLIGVTTDSVARPVGRWTECDLGRRSFRFFPVLALDKPGKRGKLPLSLRFSAALAFRRVKENFDVLEFHRVEPSLLYLFDSRPKNAFVHQNMEVLLNERADIIWKKAPWLFFKLEDFLMPRMSSVFAVRENAVAAYRKRYPEIAERFNFIPTWMDPDLFFPLPESDRIAQKQRLGDIYGWSEKDTVMTWVGRLDQQKNPILLVDAFSKLAAAHPDLRLVMVGDGVLREAVESQITELGLEGRIILAGLRSAPEVADLLRVSGIFVLSSAYEGMPMCVLEALGCGVPVATTDVGEVRRVVKPGVNGEIALEHSSKALAEAMTNCLARLREYAGRPCLDIAAEYVPAKVLVPVYDNYRRLAGGRAK